MRTSGTAMTGLNAVVTYGSVGDASFTGLRVDWCESHTSCGGISNVSATWFVTVVSSAESNGSPGTNRHAIRFDFWAHHVTVGGTVQSTKSHDTIVFHSWRSSFMWSKSAAPSRRWAISGTSIPTSAHRVTLKP